MIRMLTAFTREIDDIDAAVAEILKPLDLQKQRLKNSVGILMFHPSFLETGVIKAVSDALPFDSIGCTTSYLAAPGAIADMMLTVTVLTSDDVAFKAGATGPIADDPRAPVRELYEKLAPPGEKPSLLFTLAPILAGVGGDEFVEAIDAASGGVPLFGSLAYSHLPDLSGIATTANGEAYADRLTLIAMFGEVRPEFFIATVPEDKIIHQEAVITQAEGNQIQRINKLPPLKYLESIGLAEDGNVDGIGSTPLILTLGDGSRVVRNAYKATDEGYILCYGATPQDALIGFANCNAEFVVTTTSKVIGQAAASGAGDNALIFSCAGRMFALGLAVEVEMEEIAGRIGASRAWHCAYSGGEICPVANRRGELVNRFHNFSMIVCLFG